jgi:hypothetical protein
VREAAEELEKEEKTDAFHGKRHQITSPTAFSSDLG